MLSIIQYRAVHQQMLAAMAQVNLDAANQVGLPPYITYLPHEYAQAIINGEVLVPSVAPADAIEAATRWLEERARRLADEAEQTAARTLIREELEIEMGIAPGRVVSRRLFTLCQSSTTTTGEASDLYRVFCEFIKP